MYKAYFNELKRFSSLRTEKRQVISSYATLLKFVHDIHSSNFAQV